jgi:DNA primase
LAGSFSQDFIESVRNAGDISHLVADYVPLKRAGARLKGLCPFHEEKTPSFSVDPERQLFYCFGCQAGGDIFKFVQLYESLNFPESVEFLAKRWGIKLPERGRRTDEGPAERVLAMNREAREFFAATLFDREGGPVCRRYLKSRGIDGELAKKLQLGYAPDSWEALRNHLGSRGYKADEIMKGGLTLPRKSGSGQYDRFRGRLIFPIQDVQGRTVAFGGRVIGDAEPKYINSPETPAYTKGEHLYGLDMAREAIRKKDFVIVVEGYLDAAALIKAGIENVVASCGTAFTVQQARLLQRYTNKVLFSYDGDAAGASATERSLDLLLSRGFDVRIVELPGGLDPDDYINKEGAEAYGKLVDEAPEYLEFIIRRETRKPGLERIDQKVAAANAVLAHIAKLGGAIERGAWASRLADALRIDDELVLQELRGAVKSSAPAIRQRTAATRPPKSAECRLVAILLESEEDRRRWVEGECDLAILENSQVLPIVRCIVDLARRGAQVDHPAVFEALQNESDRDLLTRIAFREEPENGPSMDDCLAAFRKQKLAREGKELRREIGARQREGVEDVPPTDVDRQLTRLLELARQRDALC